VGRYNPRWLGAHYQHDNGQRDTGGPNFPDACRLTNDPLSGSMKHMRKATRISKSFTIDRSTLDYLHRTRSIRSRSERVNQLLRRAILAEQNEALEREAAEFFAAPARSERAESKAFAAASRRSIARSGD